MIRQVPSVRPQVLTVAERWKAQYYDHGAWSPCLKEGSEAIYKRLLALKPSASAKDVASIIGNYSWVGRECVECQKPNAVVEIEHYDETMALCRKCVRRLLELAESKRRVR